MGYFGIEHKLHVFISSKCGGKYSIARIALKRLLEATGLMEVYVFETEPASSEDNQSAYLEYIDSSNLCIFLIDNKDGATPPVLSEERRAKDRGLRLLYLFCDEEEKTHTLMQESIKTSESQKYAVVHQFSELVPKAFDSVMQDIISIYRKKEINEIVDNDNEEDKLDYSINDNIYSLKSRDISSFENVYKVFTREFNPMVEFGTDDVSIDTLLSSHLCSVLWLRPYDYRVIDELSSKVIKKNDGIMCDILELRFQAQKKYYSSDYLGCLSLLQDAIALALSNKVVPGWLVNDIAVDIRHVQCYVDAMNNCITVNNPGQEYLDSSDEPVVYPYLDRQVRDMQDEVINEYYSQLTISPYTASFGGLKKLFVPLANSFCVASIHGSIVQTEMTRNRLITVYAMLCSLYNNHSFIVEYIRLLVVNRDSKSLDTFIRLSVISVEVLNYTDIDLIYESINNISDADYRMQSKYILASRLGYYMSEESYGKLCSELVEYSIKWINDENANRSIANSIFDYYRMATCRIERKDVLSFVSCVVNKRASRYYDEGFKALDNMDYNNLTESEQKMMKDMFTVVVANENKILFSNSVSSALIRFAKIVTIPINDLELLVKQEFPDYYRNKYSLEMANKTNGDLFGFIKFYLDEQKERNIIQGKNGTFHVYAYESLDVIYNILKFSSVDLDNAQLKSIITVVMETLASDRQTIKAKMSAVRLLQIVCFNSWLDEDSLIEIKNDLVDNSDLYSIGAKVGFMDKEINAVLSLQYNLFVSNFDDSKTEVVLEDLYSFDMSDSYNVIILLDAVATYLEDSRTKLHNEQLLMGFLYYCIVLTKNNERDIRYKSTKCLVELTNYECTRRIALNYLLKIMDEGSEYQKIAIITRISKIVSYDDRYVEQIINKGLSDNNYLVRYVTNRETNESLS